MMGRKLYSLLLILLLVSASSDDLWARATPDPSDDLAATENNQYTILVRLHQLDRPQGSVAFHDCPDECILPPSPAVPAPGRLSEVDFSVPFAPAPLYLFMSLQR